MAAPDRGSSNRLSAEPLVGLKRLVVDFLTNPRAFSRTPRGFEASVHPLQDDTAVELSAEPLVGLKRLPDHPYKAPGTRRPNAAARPIPDAPVTAIRIERQAGSTY